MRLPALRLASKKKGTHSSRTLALDLDGKTLVLGAQLRRKLLAEVLDLEERANLDLPFLTGHGVRAAAQPLDRLFRRLDLPNPVAGDELLGLGERTADAGLRSATRFDSSDDCRG